MRASMFGAGVMVDEMNGELLMKIGDVADHE
jgi:hypothetical protein